LYIDIEKINKLYYFLKSTFLTPIGLVAVAYLLGFETADGIGLLWDLAVYLYLIAIGLGFLFYVVMAVLAEELGKSGFLWLVLSFIFPVVGGIVAFVMIRGDVMRVRLTAEAA